MGRTIITTVDVRAAGRNGRLAVPSNAIVTAAAVDMAADTGVTVLRAEPVAPVAPGASAPAYRAAGGAPAASARPSSEGDLAAQVRRVVAAVLAAGGGLTPVPASARLPVKAVPQQGVQLERFPYPGPPPGMDVRTADVVTDADGSPMAAGYMTITQGSFPWTLHYDEIQIVLEGELHLGTADGVRIGKAGDVLYVPKGNAITFGTPTWAKFVYVTFPADWEAQG